MPRCSCVLHSFKNVRYYRVRQNISHTFKQLFPDQLRQHGKCNEETSFSKSFWEMIDLLFLKDSTPVSQSHLNALAE